MSSKCKAHLPQIYCFDKGANSSISMHCVHAILWFHQYSINTVSTGQGMIKSNYNARVDPRNYMFIKEQYLIMYCIYRITGLKLWIL